MANLDSGPVFLLPHVPKCAGTTVELHLAEHLGPTGFWSPARRARRLPVEILGRKWDPRLPGPAEGVRAVSGHYVGRSVERLFPGREIWRGALLRDPAALLLSWYNYRMMRYRAAGKAPYPFALAIAAQPVDPMAHFLLERWCELPWWQIAALSAGAKQAMLDGVLGGFDMVADISAADGLIAEVSRGLGIPESTQRRNTAEDWTAAVDWQPVRLADLAPETRAELARRTALDRYLWRRWALGERAAEPGETAGFLGAELRRPLAELRRRRARGGGAGGGANGRGQ